MVPQALTEIFKRSPIAEELKESLFTYVKRNYGIDKLFPMWFYGDQGLKIMFHIRVKGETSEGIWYEVEVFLGQSPENSWRIEGASVKDYPHQKWARNFGGFKKASPENLILWLCNNIHSWYKIKELESHHFDLMESGQILGLSSFGEAALKQSSNPCDDALTKC